MIGISILLPNLNAQKLKKNEIDKFTKEIYMQTSSAKIVNNFGFMRPHKFECYIERQGDLITMPALMQFDMENVSIDENSGVVFLLDNESTVTLKTAFVGDPNRFNEFSTSFILNEEDVKSLKEYKVKALRMVYVGGHYDSEVKEKNQDIISKMLELVTNN